MELLAALLALRLAEFIYAALQTRVSKTNIVSDSLMALSWIRSSKNQRDQCER